MLRWLYRCTGSDWPRVVSYHIARGDSSRSAEFQNGYLAYCQCYRVTDERDKESSRALFFALYYHQINETPLLMIYMKIVWFEVSLITACKIWFSKTLLKMMGKSLLEMLLVISLIFFFFLFFVSYFIIIIFLQSYLKYYQSLALF